jgi:hypothetical protein
MLSLSIEYSVVMRGIKYRLAIFFLLPSFLMIIGLAKADAVAPLFKVSGNKVLTSSGKEFMPEGISVYGGLESPNYEINLPNDYAQITAADKYWHANTVRLQVAESNLFSHLKHGETYNHNFLSELSRQVSFAQELGMVVVINDQTEFTTHTPSPTNETVRFWQIIAKKYKNDPSVIFDLFNEPRLTKKTAVYGQDNNKFIESLIGQDNRPMPLKMTRNNLPPSEAWSLWQSGGSIGERQYIGMQNVVNAVRSTGSSNLIWVEGTYGAHRLPPEKYLLSGSNLVYSIHHPNLNKPSSWNYIGELSQTRPVIEGEWAQYQSDWAECFSDAYSNAPMYLNYLHVHNIGVIAWSLQTNSLLRGSDNIRPTNLNTPYDPKKPQDLRKPDHLTTNYVCDTKQHGQGIGRLVYNYFSKYSQKYSLNI